MCCSLWIAALNTSRISKPAGISFLEEKRKNDDCVQAGETRLKGGQGMRHTKCWIVAVASLLHSKVKLGADASFAAGPKGRSAAADTDAYMRAEILSYSRARGVFMRGGKNEIRKVAQLGRSSWDGSNTTMTLMTGSSKKLKSPISSSLT